jgi:glycosyltransferase involved in cell wall biosynthesis
MLDFSPVHILQISHGIYPVAQAGTEIYTAELTQELIRQRHKVTVVIPATARHLHAASAGELPPFVVPLHLAPEGRFGNKLRYAAFRGPVWHDELLEIIKRTNVDVIHVQHGMGFGLSLFDALERSGLPLVIGLPDYWLTCPGIHRRCEGNVIRCAKECCSDIRFAGLGYFARLVAAKAHRIRVKRFVTRARPYLAAISPKTRRIFESEGFPKELIHDHPWGIDVGALRKTRQQENKQAQIGYLGTLSAPKGCHILAEAFIRSQPIDAKLHFYGGGDKTYIESLKQQCDGADVAFHGRFDHRSVAEILSGLDVVVVPSIWEETYCLVAQEALAAGKVIVVSNIGGLADRIVHGVNGFLVPANDPVALSNELSRIVSRLPQVRGSLDFDRGLLDIADDARSWISVYQDLTDNIA